MDNEYNDLDQLEKWEREEFQKNPFVNLAQSVNNATFGSPLATARIGCLPSIILIVVILILYWILR